jgi:hypothetical protein
MSTASRCSSASPNSPARSSSSPALIRRRVRAAWSPGGVNSTACAANLPAAAQAALDSAAVAAASSTSATAASGTFPWHCAASAVNCARRSGLAGIRASRRYSAARLAAGRASIAAAPISGWAGASLPSVSVTTPAMTASSIAAAGSGRPSMAASASGTVIRPAAATTVSARAAGGLSERFSRYARASRASGGTGVPPDGATAAGLASFAMLAQISLAQKGLPRDWLATIRACAAVAAAGSSSRTCAGASGASASSSAELKAASSRRQPSGGAGAPMVSGSAGASVRAASSSDSAAGPLAVPAAGPPRSRRSANPSAPTLAASSHWTSSTASITGPAARRQVSAASTPRPIACADGGWLPAGRAATATSSASRCGSGIPGITSGIIPPSRSDSPANGESASLAEGSLRSTRQPPDASRMAARHSRDLPVPASPVMASAACSALPAAATANFRACRHSAARTNSPLGLACAHPITDR